MVQIDARNMLIKDKLDEFRHAIGKEDCELTLQFVDDESINIDGKLSTMREFFENSIVEETINVLGKKCEIEIVTKEPEPEIYLVFLGSDVWAWIKPLNGEKYVRLNSLFKKPRKKWGDYEPEPERNQHARESLTKERIRKEKKADQTTYKLAVGIRKDNSVTDIETYEGNQKGMKDFVNTLYARNMLRSFGRCISVFCVNYKYEDDLNDINNWKTLQELEDEGVFVK